ncbi:WecB/TagA/CpsF family glycosyltransferase [Enterococcus sp. PF-2]|uniref:WecB/TagA/CpsF family glycosyltransferase n=1 Tax=Enterococcus TaxID=1350 RepID=UPI000C779E4F|nr:MULTISPECIES: WecB/TagA/CpsF family glycosyltransferase [unclassified Enterococcus]MBO1122103.1 WecB/TagA/CpsF family glycosyltransferase [Enterococcus casseliflavus]MDF2534955.1 WecB/TagA/CpsF family glycosyltransferase [Bacillales bacterium]AUJ85034.1 glycosyltransferase [Enterococcus sp. CR-Ec1]MEC5315814.1 WecB/TagA/CpsF family glycosyltransferase [Enterococcus casseliflavus]TPE03810.1 WecB/TagA/CpsF family glycosyltransferase [Enterococcus sp. PF-3]
MRSELIMGIPVDNISYDNIIEDVSSYLDKQNKMTIVSINPQIVTESKKYPDIVDFIWRSTHRIPDGIGIVLVSRLTGGSIFDRVTGYDLMIRILAFANENKKRIFLYGAKPCILEDTVKNIKHSYPDLIVAGAIDGYNQLKEEEIVSHINESNSDMLFVALGFPRQEQWLARNIRELNVSIFQDVGGSFDVISGHVKRAPNIFIKFHLEWLYRSLSNPKRLGRILQLPIFLCKSIVWSMRNLKRDR